MSNNQCCADKGKSSCKCGDTCTCDPCSCDQDKSCGCGPNCQCPKCTANKGCCSSQKSKCPFCFGGRRILGIPAECLVGSAVILAGVAGGIGIGFFLRNKFNCSKSDK